MQLAVALILGGATTMRPGSLIRSLCYKDVQFLLFPPAPGSTRARVGMTIRIRKVKRTAGKSKPKVYGFHEEDTLFRDPLLYIQGLAFADGAFKNDFKDPEDIYKLTVPPGSSHMAIPWKEDWGDKPIFQDIQGRGKNVTIAIN